MSNDLRFPVGWIACGLALLSVSGCLDAVSGEKFRDTQRQLQLVREQVTRLESRLTEQQQTIRTLRSQIAQLRGMDDEQMLEQLVVPVRVELASLSGGYDTDGKPGDDGILLFLRPVDRDGHAIKAAGSLEVTIYDLNMPPDHNLVARYSFAPEALRELWYGRLMTHHFSVRCPWPSDYVPAHDKLTAHVVFTDLLTGQELSVQESFTITLPPEPDSPASS